MCPTFADEKQLLPPKIRELTQQFRPSHFKNVNLLEISSGPASHHWIGGVGSVGVIIVSAALVAGVLLVWNSFYQVQPEEVGVIRRFGRYVEPPTPPGLRFKLPFIDVVDKVPVQRQLKLEFGFRTPEASVRTLYSQQDFLGESLMLTGDLNVAVVKWIIQYRVSDPERYLFRVRNVTDTFRDMTEAVIRAVVGDRTVTEVLTVGRQEIEATVQERLQEMANPLTRRVEERTPSCA